MKLIILLTTFLFFGFTPFAPIPPAPDTITTKGGLLTNNGTADVVNSACSNGEILEWDSTQTNGIKCVTKPVDTNAGTLCVAGQYLDGDGTCKTMPASKFFVASSGVIGTYTSPPTDDYSTAISGLSVSFTKAQDGYVRAFLCPIDDGINPSSYGVMTINTFANGDTNGYRFYFAIHEGTIGVNYRNIVLEVLGNTGEIYGFEGNSTFTDSSIPARSFDIPIFVKAGTHNWNVGMEANGSLPYFSFQNMAFCVQEL